MQIGDKVIDIFDKKECLVVNYVKNRVILLESPYLENKFRIYKDRELLKLKKI